MTSKTRPMSPTPRPPPSTQGPAIDASLVSWLDQNAGARTLELPLHFADAFELGRAILRNGELEIPLLIDSTALSMTLRSHLSPHCEGFPCAVWVRGTWGPLLSSPASQPTFTVRSVMRRARGATPRIRLVADTPSD